METSYILTFFKTENNATEAKIQRMKTCAECNYHEIVKNKDEYGELYEQLLCKHYHMYMPFNHYCKHVQGGDL